jgi:methionine biosynthesis protein MetW
VTDLNQSRTQPTAQLDEDRHWWFAGRTRALQTIIDALPLTNSSRVLDIGCGAGNMIHHLSRYGQVKGVEIDARPVAVARQRGYDVDQGDAGRGLTYADAAFDLVTALDVIEHNQDDLSILREAYRVLKAGGHIVVTVPAFMWLWSHNDEINAHVRRYTSPELRARLQQAGFRTQRATYNNFFVFPIAAALILMRRGSQKRPQLASHHLDAQEYQVEMEPAPAPVNAALTALGWLEALVLRGVNLPVGTSIIAIGQKPA